MLLRKISDRLHLEYDPEGTYYCGFYLSQPGDKAELVIMDSEKQTLAFFTEKSPVDAVLYYLATVVA